MDFAYAISYVFEDRQWVRKLVPLAVFSFFSLLPIIGFLPLAVVLGYLYDLAANVRQGLPRPLPKWTNYDEKFIKGGQVMLAIIAYHLPLIILGGCSTWLLSTVAGGFLGGTTFYVVMCCTVPFFLLYLILAWPLLALGISESIETGEPRRMIRTLHLWDVLTNHVALVVQWMAYVLLVNIAATLLMFIPCLGWIIALLFAVPVQGHLLGQFAHHLSRTNKPEPRKRPAPQR
jgi:hypothetical protein